MKPERKDIREERTNVLGVQQWNKGPRSKRGDSKRMRMASDRTAGKTIRLEIERSVVRSAVGLKEINKSAIWKIYLPPKRKNILSLT
jgi:hypothetical protein